MAIASSSHATMREEIKTKQVKQNRHKRKKHQNRLQQLTELNAKRMETPKNTTPENTLMTFQSDISVQFEPPATNNFSSRNISGRHDLPKRAGFCH